MAVLHARGRSHPRILGQPRRAATRRFIPDGDGEFAQVARTFAQRIKNDAQRYALTVDDAQIIEQAVSEFRDVRWRRLGIASPAACR